MNYWAWIRALMQCCGPVRRPWLKTSTWYVLDICCSRCARAMSCRRRRQQRPTFNSTWNDIRRWKSVKVTKSLRYWFFSVPRICIIEFQVVEVLQMIFESPTGYPSLEELVLSDLFRNIDLREMRGSCVPVRLMKLLSIKSNNTINQYYSRSSTVSAARRWAYWMLYESATRRCTVRSPKARPHALRPRLPDKGNKSIIYSW